MVVQRRRRRRRPRRGTRRHLARYHRRLATRPGSHLGDLHRRRDPDIPRPGLVRHPVHPPYSWHPGYFADPATLTRKIIPPGPLGQANPALIWTGRAIIAIDLDASIGGHGSQGPIRPDDMALWDPAADRWLRLPAPPGYPQAGCHRKLHPGQRGHAVSHPDLDRHPTVRPHQHRPAARLPPLTPRTRSLHAADDLPLPESPTPACDRRSHDTADGRGTEAPEPPRLKLIAERGRFAGVRRAHRRRSARLSLGPSLCRAEDRSPGRAELL